MTLETVDVQPDAAAVARHVAEWLTERALATPGRFVLGLSGGSTPKALYTLLASEPFKTRFPWQRTHVFIGDERFVPPDHPDSNEGMARQALLNHVPLPPEQIYTWPTDTTPEDGAARYARTLREFYGADTLDPARPLFDVNLLGLGEDGHTASLFPGVAALQERSAWTAAVIGAKPEPRLTLTYPVLNSARVVAFMVAGAGKKSILERALAHDTALPAVGVRPLGDLVWFVDKAATE